MNDKLTPKDFHEIKKLSKNMRSDYNIEPLGENIFRILKNLDIHLVYYPIELSGENPNPFRAVYLSAKGTKNDKIRFIAINTNDYLDSILFAVGHELYHFTEDTSLDIYRLNDEESQEYREQKANRFAAELLLPEEAVLREVAEWNDGIYDLNNWDEKKLLRFIAYLHCQYWVPYKCIVYRLFETKCISEKKVNVLLHENTRDEHSEFYKTAVAVDSRVFSTLNNKMKNTGMDSVNMEMLLENYEKGIVSVDEIARDLSCFNKTLADYSLEEQIDSDVLDDLERMFEDLEDDSE